MKLTPYRRLSGLDGLPSLRPWRGNRTCMDGLEIERAAEFFIGVAWEERALQLFI